MRVEQTSYLVDKLRSMGLVSDIRFDNDALKLRLPLSPIGDVEEVSAPEPAPAAEEPEKRQQKKSRKSVETLVDLCDPELDPFAISTDGCQYNQDHHPVSTHHGLAPIDTDKGEGTSPSGADGAIHLQRCSKNLEGKPAALSYEAIEQILRKSGFRLLDHEVTRNIIRGWIASNLDEVTLEAALYKLVKDDGDLVAGEADREIRLLRKARKTGAKKSILAL